MADITLRSDKAYVIPLQGNAGTTIQKSLALTAPAGTGDLVDARIYAFNRTTGEQLLDGEPMTITNAALRECTLRLEPDDLLDPGVVEVYIHTIESDGTELNYPGRGRLLFNIAGETRRYERATLLEAQESVATDRVVVEAAKTEINNIKVTVEALEAQATAASGDAAGSAGLAQQEAANASYPANARAYADEAAFLASGAEFGIFSGAVWRNNGGAAEPVMAPLWRVGSVSELKQQVGFIGARASLSSYYSALQGGGGMLYWSATNPHGADALDVLAFEIKGDGATHGYWLRENADVVDVRQAGAMGDGVADDTIPIQKCLTVVRRVTAARGDYRTTNTLYVKSGQVFTGVQGPTQVQIFASGAYPVIQSVDAGVSRYIYSEISNITVEGENLATYGIELVDAAYLTMRNVRVNNCTEDGIRLRASASFLGYNYFEAVHAIGCKRGIVIADWMSASHFVRCVTNANSEVGMEIAEGDSISLDACDISSNVIGIRVGGSNVSLRDTYVELNTNYDYHILPSGKDIHITHTRASIFPPANILNESPNAVTITVEGESVDVHGRRGINLIPNGNFTYWPSGDFPPYVGFIVDGNWNSLVKSKTADGWMRCVGTNNTGLFRVRLDHLLPIFAGKKVCVGFRWRGDPANGGTGNKIFRLYADDVSLGTFTYAKGAQSQTQGTNVAYATYDVPEGTSSLYLRITVTNLDSPATDAIEFKDIFACLGTSPPSTSVAPLTGAGGLLHGDLTVAEGNVLLEEGTTLKLVPPTASTARDVALCHPISTIGRGGTDTTAWPQGYMAFDTTLGKPVWLKTPGNPGQWVDATGAVV